MAGAALVDLSDLVNLMTGGASGAPEQVNFFKNERLSGTVAAQALGRWLSMWQYDGMPQAGAVPTTAVVETNATTGSFKQATPAAGAKKRLMGISATSYWSVGGAAGNSGAGSLVLYDRLVDHGGFSGTVTTAQTTNMASGTPTLTRYTSGVGVQAWVEIYTALGATSTTYTLAYDGDSGTGHTSRATPIGGTNYNEAQRLIPTALLSGDKGVKKVTSCTVLASTLTAGNFGITLAYPLVVMPIFCGGSGFSWNSILTSGGPLDLGTNSDACLAFAWMPFSSTNASIIMGMATFFEK